MKVKDLMDYNLYPLPLEVMLEIKDKHIKMGKKVNCHRCPVAIAMAEYLQCPEMLVWAGIKDVGVGLPDIVYPEYLNTEVSVAQTGSTINIDTEDQWVYVDKYGNQRTFVALFDSNRMHSDKNLPRVMKMQLTRVMGKKRDIF